MTSRAAVLLAALALSLAGCGGGSSSPDTPKASGPIETWPDCSEVWVTGQTLPKDYEGCVIKGNEAKPFVGMKCPSGAKYGSYEDRWYAVLGGTVQESAQESIFSNPKYQKFTQSC